MPVSIGGTSAALSADISEHGFRLETPKLINRGTELTGFVLHGDLELNWAGRVTWVRPGDPQLSTWHELGVQFTQVSPGLRALLSIRLRG
jgi:Tfp pilus assembly protein PilZ